MELAKHRKPSTIEFYRQRLEVLYPFAEANDMKYLDEITPKPVRRYRDWRLDYIGVSKSTVRQDEVALKQLTKYGVTQGWLTYDSLRDYDPIAAKHKERAAAKDEDLDKVQRVIENWKIGCGPTRRAEARYVRERDRMTLLTQMETGARSGEVLSMTLKSLLREDGMIHFTSSGMADTRKNGDDLIVKAGAYWWSQLDAFLKIRSEIKNEDEPLFCLIEGGQMTSRQWAHRLGAYCKAAGVAGLTSHCIRTRVGGIVAESQGIFAATRQLGQRSMQSAQRYTKQAGKSKEYMSALYAAVSPLENFARATGRLGPEKVKKNLAYRV